MSLDIHTGIQAALLLIGLLVVILIWTGIRLIRSARRLPFFRMRRARMVRAWRMFFISILLIALAFFLNTRAEPLIYSYFPPTATLTLTPTITITPTTSLTPTITLSPTITRTPSVTDTPTITPTPYMPLSVESVFTSTVTPNPDAIFSELVFTDGVDEEFNPLNQGTEFQNPIGHIFALFSYDGMVKGSQWTALWYRAGELVHYETIPWDGETGGYGYADWGPDPSEWLPGEYEVQLFIGSIWKQSGRFTVIGEQPTAAPTLSPTPSATLTPTPTPTRTPIPSATPIPTRTPRPTATTTLTPTITLTRTPYISPTRPPTQTPWPTVTKSPVTPSITPQPTATPWLTRTPRPTSTFTPSP